MQSLNTRMEVKLMSENVVLENQQDADREPEAVTRREAAEQFGKVAVAGAVAAAAVGGLAKFAHAEAAQAQWGMLVDLDRCIGCQACAVACKAENDVPLGMYRRRVHTVTVGKFPNVKRWFVPMSCMHCADPACLKACQEKAIAKGGEGLVQIDVDKCRKKKTCTTACPYRNISIHPVKEKADKCTFCAHRVKEGLQPACVQTCTGGALSFGNLADPNSDIAKAIKAKKAQQINPRPGVDTKPNFYYAGLTPELKKELTKLLSRKGEISPRELEDNI